MPFAFLAERFLRALLNLSLRLPELFGRRGVLFRGGVEEGAGATCAPSGAVG